MSFLARFRILTKILAVILLLSAVAGGITFLGVNSLKSDITLPVSDGAAFSPLQGHRR